MSNVRARMVCTAKTPHEGYTEIALDALYDSDESHAKTNASWSEATPSGRVTMTITNPAAVDAFELNRAYYIDFSPVDDE